MGTSPVPTNAAVPLGLATNATPFLRTIICDSSMRTAAPFRDGEFIGNFRPIPIVCAELFEKILDGDPLLFLFSFGRREPRG